MYLTPRQILLAGATDLIGAQLLDRLLSEPTIQRVQAPTHMPLAEHPRLQNPVGEFAALLAELEGPVDVAFCCLASTCGQTDSQKTLINLDANLVRVFASRARKLGARHLVVISAPGADPHSTDPCHRVKGAMEQALQAQGWPQLTITRPAQLLGPRSELRIVERLTAPLLRLLPGKYQGIEASVLARALWRLALEESEGTRIVESEELRKLGK